jgi:hypothetical protein
VNLLKIGLITATLLMALAIGSVTAETPPTNADHDVVVLKNGGVARGRIIETDLDHTMLLVLSDEIIKIDTEDIAFVTDKKNFDPTTVPVYKGNHLWVPKKYHLFIQGAALLGGQSPNFSVSVAVGPQVTEYLVVAVGAQLDRYTRKVLTGRIHIYVLGALIPNNVVLKDMQVHFGFGVGQFVTDRIEPLRNGVTNISLSLGEQIRLNPEAALMVELGYHHQSMFTRAKHIPDEHSLTLSLGLRF